MADTNDWNAAIIEEFRAHDGKVGGMFEGRPLLLLHTTGAKTGAARVHPLMYQQVGDAYAVFASKAGAASHPAWYHNLVANPHSEIEVGNRRVAVTARVINGEERERIWSKQKLDYPQFAEYDRITERQIPVIVLERRS